MHRVEARSEANSGDEESRHSCRPCARTAARVEAPNESDSLRTFIEQLIEDVLVDDFGAGPRLKSQPTRACRYGFIRGRSRQSRSTLTGAASDAAAHEQVTGASAEDAVIPLLDRSSCMCGSIHAPHTVFGLGKIDDAFETITQFCRRTGARAGLATNSVVQYALWMQNRTPEQHERLIQWWQDEVEGTGRVPVMKLRDVPQVLRFGGGTTRTSGCSGNSFC